MSVDQRSDLAISTLRISALTNTISGKNKVSVGFMKKFILASFKKKKILKP